MDKIMLIISAGEWDGIKHRPHHFARRTATSGWTVLYLEPPASIIAPFKNKTMLRRWRNWRKGLRRAEGNIHLIAPPPILPFGNRFRFINRLNQRLIARAILNAVKNRGQFMNSINKFYSGEEQIDLYTYLPSAVDLLPLFDFKTIIYDCVDDHAAFTGLHSEKTLAAMEQELMAVADVSFATAKQLQFDRINWSDNFHLIPNGAEYDHFAPAVEPLSPQPQELINIEKPIIGFVGGISDWINIELIAKTAELLPEYQFVLIGPIATDVTVLTDQPNINLLGSKDYKELPYYLSYFAVCLIPFRINKLTESVNPIKMYEYLAAGRAIVATPMPEVSQYEPIIRIAATAEDTATTIRELLRPEANEEIVIKQRQELAYNNSWNSRWLTALSHIEKIHN